MASIRQTPTGYRVEIRKRQKLIHSKTFTDEDQAQAYGQLYDTCIAEILNLTAKQIKKLTPKKAEQLGGVWLFGKLGIEVNFLTFHSLIDEYLAQWSGKDWANQQHRANYWKQHIDDIPVKSIKPKQLRKILDKLSSQVKADGTFISSNTVRRYRSVLSAIFTYALEKQHVKENPLENIRIKATPNQVVRYLSDDERIALLAACKDSDWERLYLLVLLAITTGMRKSELMNLRWTDIDFDNNLAYLADTKNGSPRVNPIPDVVMQELRVIRQVGSGLIFPSERVTGRPFEFTKQWKKALSEAGITDFRFHDLRHTSASYLVMNGASLHETAEILGHKSVQTTKRYAHLSTGHKSELSERVMGKIFS